MKEILVGFFVISGAIFVLIAALGVIRFPDTFSRMHAGSKATSLGMGLILVGVIVHFASWAVAVKCGLIILFIFLTTPVAAHILCRAAYLSGSPIWEKTHTNELEPHYERVRPGKS